MATQTIRTWTNVTPAAANIDQGTDYYLPNPAGDSLLSGFKTASLLIDQTNQPSGQAYELAIEVGTAGTWVQIQDALMGSGPIPFANNINSLSVGINAIDAAGALIGTYPDHVRLHVKRYGGWNLPSVKLNVS